VIYRLADRCAIHVHSADKEPEVIHGNRLDSVWSASLFRRENRLVKLVVEIPETELRN
jgi:hypothetical protein